MPTLFFVSLLLTSGCATKNNDLYHWGEYEKILLDTYVNPGSLDTLSEIQQLNEGIQQAENKGKKVPPGIYAHLGYLYAIQGNIAESKSAFIEEKTLFPESTAFIDGILKRASNNGVNN